MSQLKSAIVFRNLILLSQFLPRRNEAASKPRKEFVPKTLADLPLMGEGMTGTGRTTPGLADGLNGIKIFERTIPLEEFYLQQNVYI